MQIIHDRSYINQADQEFISRGYACESLYWLCFFYAYTETQKAENGAYADKVGLDSIAWNTYAEHLAQRRSSHMERIAAVLAQNLKVDQYGSEEAVPGKSDWDLFFWCGDFSSSEGGLLSGRDYTYFMLIFNNRHGHERRKEVYDRVMHVLKRFVGDENLEVTVKYTAIMDDARIKHDAALVAPRIAGRNCVCDGMEGCVEQGREGLYFCNKQTGRRLYHLNDADILALSWQLSV